MHDITIMTDNFSLLLTNIFLLLSTPFDMKDTTSPTFHRLLLKPGSRVISHVVTHPDLYITTPHAKIRQSREHLV